MLPWNWCRENSMRTSSKVYRDHEDVWDVMYKINDFLNTTDNPKARIVLGYGELEEIRSYIRDLERELDNAINEKTSLK